MAPTGGYENMLLRTSLHMPALPHVFVCWLTRSPDCLCASICMHLPQLAPSHLYRLRCFRLAAVSMADLCVQHILQEAAEEADAADEVCGLPLILAAPASLLDSADVEVQHPTAGARKRKAAAPRRPRPNELCPGRAGRSCPFSLRPDAFGQPASLQKGDKACMWCDPERLNQTLQVPQRRKHVTRALRIWTDADQAAVLARAWEAVPVEQHAPLRAALQRPSRAQGAVAARKAAAAEAQSWEGLLDRRVNLGLPVADNAEAVYLAKTADDNRRIRSKFGALMRARDEGAADWRSPTAERFEKWCRSSSWVLCEQCLRLEPRPAQDRDMAGARPRKNTVRRCPHCRAGVGYPTVSVDMIPLELRNLSLDVLWALRPLEPDVGLPVFAKHGYRVHTDMIRFWWRPQTVTVQIQALNDAQERGVAEAAYRHLMSSTDSSYAVFVQMHERFLRRNRASLTGEAGDPRLRLPRRALEEEGLECAVWPHLYPKTAMCETYIRKADSRRRERQNRRASRPAAVGSSDSEDEHVMDTEDDPEEAAAVAAARRLRTRRRPPRRWTSRGPAAIPPRPPTWPRFSAPSSATAPITSSSSSSMTCGCGAPSAPRRTRSRHHYVWPWRAIPFLRNTGRRATPP